MSFSKCFSATALLVFSASLDDGLLLFLSTGFCVVVSTTCFLDCFSAAAKRLFLASAFSTEALRDRFLCVNNFFVSGSLGFAIFLSTFLLDGSFWTFGAGAFLEPLCVFPIIADVEEESDKSVSKEVAGEGDLLLGGGDATFRLGTGFGDGKRSLTGDFRLACLDRERDLRGARAACLDLDRLGVLDRGLCAVLTGRLLFDLCRDFDCRPDFDGLFDFDLRRTLGLDFERRHLDLDRLQDFDRRRKERDARRASQRRGERFLSADLDRLPGDRLRAPRCRDGNRYGERDFLRSACSFGDRLRDLSLLCSSFAHHGDGDLLPRFPGDQPRIRSPRKGEERARASAPALAAAGLGSPDRRAF